MGKKNKILLIEDEAALVDVYKHYLKKKGYEVEVAYDGEEGLKKVKEFGPDLVLLDIIMPRVDGLAVLKKLKRNPETEAIPVIIFTNVSAKQAIRDAVREGTTYYLLKSDITPEELSERVGEVLREQGPGNGA